MPRVLLLVASVLSLVVVVPAIAGPLSDLHVQLDGQAPRFFDRSKFRPPTLSEVEIARIGIERSGCFGSCPIYSLVVEADGSFEYIGIANVSRIGRYKGKADPMRYRSVVALMSEARYFSMQDVYSVDVTDQEFVYTMAERGGQAKVIENYAASGPLVLWAIEELIDTLLLTADWDDESPNDIGAN